MGYKPEHGFFTGESYAAYFILIFAIIVFFFPSLDVFGQNAQQKTQDLIAALGKTKHKKKEKKGFYFESYVNTESEAVVRTTSANTQACMNPPMGALLVWSYAFRRTGK
jgi:hypothetical protein